MQMQGQNTGVVPLRFAQGQNDELSGADKVKAAKLVDGAHQFEAMLLEGMLKDLKFGGAPGASEEEQGGAVATVQGFGTQAMAGAIARGGGFGIARQIIRQVGAESSARNDGRGEVKVL